MGQSKDIIILGIESSCDDTSAAVLRNGKILANITATQEVHKEFGGVVPELASRAHQKQILPVVDAALRKSGLKKSDLNSIAYTLGPGLLGSLLVGSSFAKSMAQALGIPAIPVHHMKAHVLAHFIEDGSPTPPFPFLCLTVSGGHTQLIRVQDHYTFEVIGRTLDDAAGEAFDKAAKYMGLPYPGGPIIDNLAEKGDPEAFKFTKPKVPGYDFSFSGLKTNIINLINNQTAKDSNFIEKNKNDLAASIRKTIIDMLMEHLSKLSKETGINHIAIAGGVSANKELRRRLLNNREGWTTYIPAFEYCTDNGAMIAIAGYYDHLKGIAGSYGDAAKARWAMDN